MTDDQRRERLARELGDTELAGRLVAARKQVVTTVPDLVARRHMTAILEESARTAAEPVPVRGPVVPAPRTSPADTVRELVAAFLGHGVRVAVLTMLAVLVVTAGLASTGSLPATAQGFVADAVALVGVDLPRPDPAPPHDVPPGQDETPTGTDDGTTAQEPGGGAPAEGRQGRSARTDDDGDGPTGSGDSMPQDSNRDGRDTGAGPTDGVADTPGNDAPGDARSGTSSRQPGDRPSAPSTGGNRSSGGTGEDGRPATSDDGGAAEDTPGDVPADRGTANSSVDIGTSGTAPTDGAPVDESPPGTPGRGRGAAAVDDSDNVSDGPAGTSRGQQRPSTVEPPGNARRHAHPPEDGGLGPRTRVGP